MAYLNVTVLPAAASTAEAGAGASTKAVELALALTTIEKPPTMIGRRVAAVDVRAGTAARAARYEPQRGRQRLGVAAGQGGWTGKVLRH